jgi:hypothetical protein
LIAALYIDPRGPYPNLLGAAQCWDATRDARTYEGPWPIVAHPACGPWGRLRHMYQGSEGGPELGCIAVRQVRAFGGVLEHPADSRLWEACELPRPGDPPDVFGGWTIRVNQSDWGHVCRKPTWLYLVRVNAEIAAWRPEPREPTHWVGGGRGADGTCRGKVPDGIKCASAEQRRRTPPLFAEWLALMAETAEPA